MDVYHFKNFEMLDPEAGELLGGHDWSSKATPSGKSLPSRSSLQRPASSTAAGAR